MAYDEELAERVRDVLAARSDVSERKMFGGIAFMIA
jgi:TfoX/Sxy family transcriptional regulator of competence genes